MKFALLFSVFLMSFMSAAESPIAKECPDFIELEILDVNEDFNEPIMLRFSFTPSSDQARCEFPEYGFDKAFIGRQDGYFDDIEVIQVRPGSYYTYYEASPGITWQNRDSVVDGDKKIGQIKTIGNRTFIELLVPYNIVNSEGRVYLDY